MGYRCSEYLRGGGGGGGGGRGGGVCSSPLYSIGMGDLSTLHSAFKAQCDLRVSRTNVYLHWPLTSPATK